MEEDTYAKSLQQQQLPTYSSVKEYSVRLSTEKRMRFPVSSNAKEKKHTVERRLVKILHFMASAADPL